MGACRTNAACAGAAVRTSETVFEGRRFDIQRRTYEIGGSPHVFEVIVHPGAAVILPVLDDGRIVLIRNNRVAVGKELLEVPAGVIDPGETPAECAARELAEETGYRAGKVTPLVSYYSSPGILTEQLHSFLATELTPGPLAHEAGEQIRLAPMALDDALGAIGSGEIIDGKTILTLLYYERFVRQERSER